MFGFGKNLFKSAKKIANTNTMEACIAAALLIAAADGTIERDELTKLEAIASSTEPLASFSRAEIQRVIQKYAATLETDFFIGKSKMLKEIDDVADDPDLAETVFLVAFAIARADGEVEPEEKRELLALARRLGQDASAFGLA